MIGRVLDYFFPTKHATGWTGETFEERAFDRHELFRTWWGWTVALHRFHRADPLERFHSHHANAIRVILSGGYIEEWHVPPEMRCWGVGKVGYLRIKDVHRVEAVAERTWSLWITFRRRAEVRLVGSGW